MNIRTEKLISAHIGLLRNMFRTTLRYPLLGLWFCSNQIHALLHLLNLIHKMKQLVGVVFKNGPFFSLESECAVMEYEPCPDFPCEGFSIFVDPSCM